MMHGETYKPRWFVLARVPHATVLIYYNRKCMDEDHILGYIDMRRVTAVREASKSVTLDAARSSYGGLMNKMKSMFGSHGPEDVIKRPVLELVTAARTYLLCPASAEFPPPVSMAAASGPSLYGKPLYLFGWPFPVPHLEGAVMSSPDGEGDDEHAIQASHEEANAVSAKLLNTSDEAPVRNGGWGGGGAWCARAHLTSAGGPRHASVRSARAQQPPAPQPPSAPSFPPCSARPSSSGRTASAPCSSRRRRRGSFR